ncbi:LexA-binding, inner membrane-associated putative hydrolase [Micromonospora pattaloongensis]|uniref:LexA-binding, inner membrane-associated putative hydrolase n=1 Tax=Micromonospora pattaloongensis TaxID=405436 RepID=A0A1H3QHZ1_9ACTN|nr:metal-dependent hydrolase [Micromonospora pattaloongensis]SDZ12319.1 LexA-binding, inner membrane-associated putative hydrolase [Micromonospora pattaloongensis]
MMGPSHALSGAATWLAGSWALDYFAGYEQSPLAIAVGTAVCAGGALFPDLDLSGRVTRNQGGATVARTFGVVSLFVAEVIEKISLGVYTATRLSRDPVRNNGHRTLTHTIPFTVLVGWGTTALCAHYGKWAVIGILFFMIGLALRGLFDEWAKRAGWVIVTLVSLAAAYFTYLNLPGDRGYPMIGLAVGVGCFVHIMGDIVTSNGVPILWPIPLKRRMWKMVGIPNQLAVKVGGTVETVVLRGAFTVISLLSAAGLLAPSVLRRFNIEL